MDFLRDLFGFSTSNRNCHDPNHHPDADDPRRFFGLHDEDHSNESNGKHFNVFTDPIEMHRYFEQQMDHIFRTFGFPNFGNFSHQRPALDGNLEEEYMEGEPKNLREHFLKKDYVKPHYEESGEKADNDLDGKLKLGDLDSIFKGSNDDKRLDIFRERKPFGGAFFNQSIQVKTIRKPDGSLETKKTVRDSQGNEETTITQKLGDKEYTVIKKTGKDGKEETQEIMVNLDEKDKTIFQGDHDHNNYFRTYFDNPLFDKFFK